jgi:hypothetical protein
MSDESPCLSPLSRKAIASTWDRRSEQDVRLLRRPRRLFTWRTIERKSSCARPSPSPVGVRQRDLLSSRPPPSWWRSVSETSPFLRAGEGGTSWLVGRCGEPIALGEAVSALARRLPNGTKLHAGATRPSGAPLRTFYSAASTLPAPRRSTRLAQYGGPRAGVGFGTSVGSPMPRRYRATLVGSVTSASSFILPLQHGHVSTLSTLSMRSNRWTASIRRALAFTE